MVMGRGWRAAASPGKPPELETARQDPGRLKASLRTWGLLSCEARRLWSLSPQPRKPHGQKGRRRGCPSVVWRLRPGTIRFHTVVLPPQRTARLPSGFSVIERQY